MTFWSIVRQRCWGLILVVAGVCIITFIISHLIPGDPARLLAGDRASDDIVQGIRQQLGLDQPLYIQFGRYVDALAHGDLGTSIRTGRPVAEDLKAFFPATLELAFCSLLLALVIGVPLGLVAGYFQKMWDGVISRFIEALLACPFLIMAIALGAFLGPSLTNAMIAIGLSAMPIFARLTRGQVIAIRNEEYIDGARAIGLPDRWIIIKYVLPNVMSPILVQATLAIASAIIAEASLSFLGLGQQPPNPSWGSMLNTAKGFLEQAPWMSVFPGVAIFLAVQGFNLLGDGLRDALDPRHD